MSDADIARIGATLVEHDRRITNTERTQEQIVELNRQNAVMIERMGTMQCDIGELKGGIKDIQEDLRDHTMEPAKKWSNLMWMLFSLAVGALVGYFLKQFGL